MNEKIIKVYNLLYILVLQLRIRWAQFRFLFTISDKRMNVLEHIAPGFFDIIKDVLRDDAFMSLSRLTDKRKTFGNDNLTLVALIELTDNDDLASSANIILEKLKNRVTNIRIWRDKQLAHTDYDQIIQERPLSVAVVKRGDVDEAINLTIEFMNLFAHHLSLKPMDNELPIIPGDADVLARRLESMLGV